MVLNDIIEQAAGRQSRASEQGGNLNFKYVMLHCALYINKYIFKNINICIMSVLCT